MSPLTFVHIGWKPSHVVEVMSEGGTATPTSNRPRPTDLELIQVLERVRLTSVLERFSPSSSSPAAALDVEMNWGAVLSLGEQQRLAFARVLLMKPRLALLDESTSALDQTNEEMLYTALRASKVTFVSVGHRPTLRRFHEQLLTLGTPGVGGEANDRTGWTLETLQKETAAV